MRTLDTVQDMIFNYQTQEGRMMGGRLSQEARQDSGDATTKGAAAS